jgi:hypothetical protein
MDAQNDYPPSPISFISIQNIPQEATKLKTLPKTRVGYMEIDKLANANTKKVIFVIIACIL